MFVVVDDPPDWELPPLLDVVLLSPSSQGGIKVQRVANKHVESC